MHLIGSCVWRNGNSKLEQMAKKTCLQTKGRKLTAGLCWELLSLQLQELLPGRDKR